METIPRLKICGITNRNDAGLASASGADYLGILIGVEFSERSLTLAEARDVALVSGIPVVVLLCNPDMGTIQEVSREIEPYAIQLLCQEAPEFIQAMRQHTDCQIWKTIHLPASSYRTTMEEYIEAGVDALLVDSSDDSEGFLRLGGTGKLTDWQAAATIVREASVPVFLAGGIDPDNVRQAVMTVRPHGIDLCSGVEAVKGQKDPEKLRLLVENFRSGCADLLREAL
jgi:phosphoribosylanthranilate isomerase